VTVLLIVAGSLAAQGVIPLWWAIGLATAGAVIGDQIGYAVGRWGGAALVSRFSGMLGGPERLAKAEAHARRWGGLGIFLTRWLVTPLGSVLNFTCGTAEYPWVRFLVWDVLGEALGAVMYILLGRIFSDRVVELDAALGDFSWMTVVLLAAAVMGWMLLKYVRAKKKPLPT